MIVGSWSDSAGNQNSYTLIAGKFESFDVPGANKAENQFLPLYYGQFERSRLRRSTASESFSPQIGTFCTPKIRHLARKIADLL